MFRSRPAPRQAVTAGFTAIAVILAGALTGTFSSVPTAAAAATVTFTASPTGTGTTCSTAAPCSLTTAKQQVEAVTSTAGANIVVVLDGGTYPLTQTLAFNSANGDSAPAGYTVTYEAATGATPVLSGGESVTGWTETSGTSGIWEASVPAGTAARQLYVNGVRANVASGAVPTTLTQTSTGYTASSTALDSWSDVTGAQFVYNVSWTEMMCGIASVSGETITMQEPCFQNSTLKPYGVNASIPTAMQNAEELLTQPGQWDLNTSTNTIYYMPREGQTMSTATAVIPNLQTLVSGTGTEADPLTGLAFQGISFEYGGWTAPSGTNGYSEVQADVTLDGTNAYEDQGTCTVYSTTSPGTCPYGAWDLTPGNVVFDHTSGLSITGSTFDHLGASGLQLGQDVDNSTIQGNVFTDISANGLEIGNVADADPTDTALQPVGNTISDNWVHNVAVQYTGGVGIFQGYTRNDVIEYNQVNDVPYSGISSNWGWGWNPTSSSGNVIENNLVFDYLQQHGDGGGIYVLGIEGSSLATGLTISGNVVHDSGNSNGKAIYTDGGSEYITMTGNAAYGNSMPSMGGSYEGTGTPFGNFSFTGNYFENTTPSWPAGNPTNATIDDNTEVSATGVGVPASLIADAGLQSSYASLAAPTAGTAPTNLALNAPAVAQYIGGATASLQPNEQTSYATDGNLNTAVQATGQYLWQLIVNLQSSMSLGSIVVTMPQNAYATEFTVNTSTNDSTWTAAGTVTNSGPGAYPITFSSPVTAQYIEIVADAPGACCETGGQMAISEVDAYAPTSSNAYDLALDEPAQALFIDGTQATMQSGEVPSNAVDGNTSTVSQAAGQYRWIQQVDLQSVQSLNLITLNQLTTAYATEYHIDVSVNGSDWFTVARSTWSIGGITGIQLATPVQARYIRIIADRPDGGSQTGGQMSITELGVYDL